jgi:hypothetical protein
MIENEFSFSMSCDTTKSSIQESKKIGGQKIGLILAGGWGIEVIYGLVEKRRYYFINEPAITLSIYSRLL